MLKDKNPPNISENFIDELYNLKKDLQKQTQKLITWIEKSIKGKQQGKKSEKMQLPCEQIRSALQNYSIDMDGIFSADKERFKEAQSQYLAQEKLGTVKKLAGSIGHNLRNPLCAIKNAAYFLRLALSNPDSEVEETLKIIDREVANCERVISELLNFSHLKSPIKQKVDINQLIKETLSRIQIPTNIKLQLELIPSPLFLDIDPVQVSQALFEIVLNGIQAMPKGGTLTICTKIKDHRALIAISDTGKGIKEEDKPKIFEPLFTTRTSGLGLGLVVSKKLIENNGGKISFSSIEGEGTIFTIELNLPRKEEKKYGKKG